MSAWMRCLGFQLLGIAGFDPYLSSILGELKGQPLGSYRDYSTPKRLKVTYSTTKDQFFTFRLGASGIHGGRIGFRRYVVIVYLGGCQNYGPFLGTLNNRCRTIIGTPKGTLILTTTHL